MIIPPRWRRLKGVYSRFRQALESRKVVRSLARSQEPRYFDSEELFFSLQRSYKPRPEYGYDAYSTWRRGIDRAQRLLEKRSGIRETGLRVMDAACGDGMTGYILSCYGQQVVLTDIEDWRDPRATSVPFIRGDLCDELPLEAGDYDLIVSYNAFEHLEDPEAALDELVRLCKPEGHIHLEFGPLYSSPWGLHAYRTIFIPYPQFLFSPGFINNQLQQLGIIDLGKEREVLQYVNQWRLDQFDSLWQSSGCRVVDLFTINDRSHLGLIADFPKAFQGRGLTLEDVTTQAIHVTLQKENL